MHRKFFLRGRPNEASEDLEDGAVLVCQAKAGRCIVRSVPVGCLCAYHHIHAVSISPLLHVCYTPLMTTSSFITYRHYTRGWCQALPADRAEAAG